MSRGKSRASLALIRAAYTIAEAAHPIPIRGICYKLFTLGLIPDMGADSTGRVSRQMTWARENGEMPWEWVVDETRHAERVSLWDSPDAIIDAAVRGYRRNYWQEQPNWVEVWSEKGTVRGVLAPVLNELGVTFRVHHGFSSATVINAIAEETQGADRPLTVLYCGDFDPSGMWMSERDLPERLARYGADFTLERIALDATDVGPSSGLPSFPLASKIRDPRHAWFRANYGDRCWELDALDPVVLWDRVRVRITELIDADAWEHATRVEAAEVASMREFHRAWGRSKRGQDAICSGGAS